MIQRKNIPEGKRNMLWSMVVVVLCQVELKRSSTAVYCCVVLPVVRSTCPRTTTTCACTFARFSSSGNFKPTRTSPVNNTLKQKDDGAVETSRTTNYELHTGSTGTPVAFSFTYRCTCTFICNYGKCDLYKKTFIFE